MFKIVHNLIVFPPSIFVPRQSRTGSNAYFQPFAHTNSFLHSFVPIALFHCGIHYLVMSLVHLHSLPLKPMYMHLTCFLSL